MIEFSAFLRDIYPRLRSWAEARCFGTPVEADDLIGASCARLYRLRERLDEDSDQAWRFTLGVAGNIFTELLARRRRDNQELGAQAVQEPEASPDVQEIEAATKSVSGPARKKEAMDRFIVAWRSLAEIDRKLLSRYYLEEHKLSDIARDMNQTSAAIRVRLSRVRRELRSRFSDSELSQFLGSTFLS